MLSTISTLKPPIEKEGSSISLVEIFLRLGRDPITMACVFKTFQVRLLPWNHFRKESSSLFSVIFRSLTLLAVKEMLVSSTYMVTWQRSRQNGRSLIYAIKIRCARQDPWGTPQCFSTIREKTLLTLHNCRLCWRHDVNQKSSLPDTPYFCVFFSRISWWTVSNAFFSSINTSAVYFQCTNSSHNFFDEKRDAIKVCESTFTASGLTSCRSIGFYDETSKGESSCYVVDMPLLGAL